MTKQIIAAGKTAHCGRCHKKKMFWLEQDGRYRCESCGMALLPADKVKPVTEAAYTAYAAHVKPGSEGNGTAVKASRDAWENAARETAVYRKAQPAAENDELTETLIRMRQMAAHNYPGKSNGDQKATQ